MDLRLRNLETILRKIGRGVVAYAVDDAGDAIRWDGVAPLSLAHLTDTEGDMRLRPNGSTAKLTLPEIAGEAAFEVTHLGESPTLELPLFMADPDLLSVVSPIGSASAGHIRVREVSEVTAVIFPEALFRTPAGTYGELEMTPTGWTLDGAPLGPAHQTLLGCSVWFWRAYFERPERGFRGGHGNDAKNIETVTLEAMMHPNMPDGHRLYTTGDPAAAGINILGAS